MKRSLPFLLSLAAGCAAGAVNRAPELPVTRAVLYQNGIGYFERRGKLADDVLHLRVRPDQIRDFLKSLTVVDLGNGRATSIALPIEKSRAKLLSELPDQVRAEGGLLAIAQAFRGARCLVEAERNVGGRLVGVENLGTADKADWRLSVLTDGGALSQVAVTKVKALRILDGTLEVGLKKALDVALDAGSWKPVDVTVRLSGEHHDLVVSYVVEMPAWKPAYRLVLDKAGKSLLQGWAVVDNVSGDDWKDVRLSLTAGTPLAFTYDLYTPRFPRRPHLEARDEVAQLPQEAFETSGGLATGGDGAAPAADPEEVAAQAAPKDMAPEAKKSFKRFLAKRPQGNAPMSSSASSSPPAPPPQPPRSVSAADLERNFRTLVAGNAVGSLFRYDIAEPITVGERQSALVNIVNAKVPGEDVLLFRVGQDSVSPYRAVRFANDTGLVLEAGPIAIYRSDEGGTFLGEALAQRIEKSASTFVPYALDGRVRVQLAEEQREEGVQLVKIVRGTITCETKRITRWKYDVDNGSGEEATIYVRRERRPGWKVVGQDKMIEEGGAYFIPIKLGKTGRTKVEVEEQTPVRRDVDIFNDFGRQVVALYLKNASADPRVEAQLREAMALREKIDRIEGQLQAAQEQRAALGERQAEVRENLKALGKASSNADLKRKLEGTLAELESGLNDATRREVQLSMDRSQARDRLAVIVKGIDFEPRK